MKSFFRNEEFLQKLRSCELVKNARKINFSQRKISSHPKTTVTEENDFVFFERFWEWGGKRTKKQCCKISRFDGKKSRKNEICEGKNLGNLQDDRRFFQQPDISAKVWSSSSEMALNFSFSWTSSSEINQIFGLETEKFKPQQNSCIFEVFLCMIFEKINYEIKKSFLNFWNENDILSRCVNYHAIKLSKFKAIYDKKLVGTPSTFQKKKKMNKKYEKIFFLFLLNIFFSNHIVDDVP